MPTSSPFDTSYSFVAAWWGESSHLSWDGWCWDGGKTRREKGKVTTHFKLQPNKVDVSPRKLSEKYRWTPEICPKHPIDLVKTALPKVSQPILSPFSAALLDELFTFGPAALPSPRSQLSQEIFLSSASGYHLVETIILSQMGKSRVKSLNITKHY